MRILLALETSGGGSGRHVLDLAAGLSAHGQDVTVVWSPDRAEAHFVEKLEALNGVASHPLSMRRALGLHDLRSLRDLAAFVRSAGPFDILHGHSSKAGALVRLLPRNLPGARIYTPHAFRTLDPALSGPARIFYGQLERLLALRADRLIAVSKAEEMHARSLGLGAKRVRLVMNGIPPGYALPRAEARARLRLASEEIAVGLVGRLDLQKDPIRFVRAAKHAQSLQPRLRAFVAGDGPLREAAEAEARSTAADVTFLGWRDSREIMAGLDLFCMTSRYEAMPYTLLEALHAGVPIVSTQVGGTDETVGRGVTGEVLPADASAQSIGHAIAELARDRPRRRNYSTASKSLARQRTTDRMVEQTIETYHEALAGRGACTSDTDLSP